MTHGYQEIPVDRIDCLPQVRKAFDEQHIAALADTIVQRGILQPLRVMRRGERYQLVSGECRLQAAKRAGCKTVPVIVEDKPMDAATILETQMVENQVRSDLKPLEKAAALQKLMELTKLPASAVAKRVGMSEANVAKTLALLKLPPSLQAQIGTGIPMSAAYELAKIEDAAEREKLAAAVVFGAMTRDQLAGQVKARNKPAKGAGSQLRKAVALVPGGRSVTLAAPSLDWETTFSLLEDLLARLKKARTQGMALPTALRMLRDTAKTS